MSLRLEIELNPRSRDRNVREDVNQSNKMTTNREYIYIYKRTTVYTSSDHC
jgi:hypothetical protein